MASKKKKRAAAEKVGRSRGATRGGSGGRARGAPKKTSVTEKAETARTKARSSQKKAKAPKAPKAPATRKGGRPTEPGGRVRTEKVRTEKARRGAAPAAAPKTVKVKFAPPRAPKSTIRTPEGAEELKQKLGALASAVSQIRSLKRSLNKSFYDIGQILREIRDERLYEVKGYGSFEAFVERETELGKQLSLRIVRIAGTFLKEAALKAGLERVSAALDALEGEDGGGGGGAPAGGSSTTTATGTRSPIPLHKQ